MSTLAQRFKKANRWRRGADIQMPDPTELGEDIDTTVEILELIAHGDYEKAARKLNNARKEDKYES